MSEVDTEKWLGVLFSELIRRGLDSDEHIHFKDFPLGDSPAPSLEELKDAHIGYTIEFLAGYLQEHLQRIIKDYEKLEEGLHAPPPPLKDLKRKNQNQRSVSKEKP